MANRTYARVADGRVAEIVTLPDALQPAQVFHPSLTFVLVTGAPPAIGTLFAGGAFQPAPEPPLTLADYERLVQAHVDATARSRGYADGVSLASYAPSTNAAWSAEAAAFIAWRDAVWLTVFGLQAAGQPLTHAALIAALPAVAWPTP